MSEDDTELVETESAVIYQLHDKCQLCGGRMVAQWNDPLALRCDGFCGLYIRVAAE